MNVGGVVHCFIGGNASLIERPIAQPTISELMTLTRDELKAILGLASLKITNFSKIDKNRVCELLLENWGTIILKVNQKNLGKPYILDFVQADGDEAPAPSTSPVENQASSSAPDASVEVSSSEEEDEGANSQVKMVSVKVQKFNDPDSLPLTYVVDADKTLISIIYKLFEEETGVPMRQFQLTYEKKPMDAYRRVVEFLPDPRDKSITIEAKPLVQGGGKRASSGVPKTKMSKEAKMSELEESINTTITMIEAKNPTPFATQATEMFKKVLTNVKTNSEIVFSAAMDALTVEQLKHVQKSMGTGNIDHRVTTLSKEFFRILFNTMETERKQFDRVQCGMCDCMMLMLLCQYGGEDATVGWTNITALLVDLSNRKSKEEGAKSADANMTGWVLFSKVLHQQWVVYGQVFLPKPDAKTEGAIQTPLFPSKNDEKWYLKTRRNRPPCIWNPCPIRCFENRDVYTHPTVSLSSWTDKTHRSIQQKPMARGWEKNDSCFQFFFSQDSPNFVHLLRKWFLNVFHDFHAEVKKSSLKRPSRRSHGWWW